MTLWLIGGTQESRELARAIVQPCIVTVTTEAARSLYQPSPMLQVWVGRLQLAQLQDFLQTYAISGILDASHPFATQISQMAIGAAAQYQIPYLRYERPHLQTVDTATFDSFEALLASDRLAGERVLLTIGYRFLPLFQPWQARATLFARILPSVVALEAALQSGFTSDHLIALRPPITAELEAALWQQWHISVAVAKASGAAGGEDVKQQVAAALNVKLILIDRPAIVYPHCTSSLETALQFCWNGALAPRP